MPLSGLFAAGGQIAAAGINSAAIQNATQMQINALNQQKNWVYSQLNPSTVNTAATAANIQNAIQGLQLQGQLDPGLLAARYQGESGIQSSLANILNPNSNAAQVANAAQASAMSPLGSSSTGSAALVDAALAQLKAGATLPPDVEAQLVQAGLQQSGMMSQGAASPMGSGGTILSTILGTAGLQLQQQRQQQASGLLAQASNLDAQRTQTLTSLFPNLQNLQTSGLNAATQTFNTSAANVPTTGLTGSNVANIWLARVGATNQLAGQAATVGASGILGQAAATNQGLAGLTGYLSSPQSGVGNYISNAFNNNSGSGVTSSGTYPGAATTQADVNANNVNISSLI